MFSFRNLNEKLSHSYSPNRPYCRLCIICSFYYNLYVPFTTVSGGDGSSKGAGFYLEHFPPGMPATMSELGLSMSSMSNNMNGNQVNQDVIQAGLVSPTSAAAQQGMYESVMNFALKPEKGMPPTPPGKKKVKFLNK